MALLKSRRKRASLMLRMGACTFSIRTSNHADYLPVWDDAERHLSLVANIAVGGVSSYLAKS